MFLCNPTLAAISKTGLAFKISRQGKLIPFALRITKEADDQRVTFVPYLLQPICQVQDT